MWSHLFLFYCIYKIGHKQDSVRFFFSPVLLTMGAYKSSCNSQEEIYGHPQYDDIMVVTGNDVPGYEIVKHHGVVFGLTVRSRNALSNIGAGFKAMFGGEVGVMTTNMMRSRDQAMDRMVSGARKSGANAIYAFRFDTSSISIDLTEICCYGTAVTVRKIGKY